MDSMNLHYVTKVKMTDWVLLYTDPAVDYDEYKLNVITRNIKIYKENGEKLEIDVFGDLRHKATHTNMSIGNISQLLADVSMRSEATAHKSILSAKAA